MWSESCGRVGACASRKPYPGPYPWLPSFAARGHRQACHPGSAAAFVAGERWPVSCGTREAAARGRVSAAPRARGDG